MSCIWATYFWNLALSYATTLINLLTFFSVVGPTFTSTQKYFSKVGNNKIITFFVVSSGGTLTVQDRD